MQPVQADARVDVASQGRKAMLLCKSKVLDPGDGDVLNQARRRRQ